MRIIRIISYILLILQLIIGVILIFDCMSISHLHGSGRAQSEMIIIGPLIVSLIIAAISGISLILILILFLVNKKLRFKKDIILLLLLSLFSPLFLLAIAMLNW